MSNLAPADDATETSNLLTFVSNDLTVVDEETVADIDLFLKNNLNTDDTIRARVNLNDSVLQDQTLTFVQELEQISISSLPTVLTPFVDTVPASDITLQLDDLSTEAVSFDESLNTITVASNTYSIGDTFILDGKKVSVSELN